MTGWTKGEVAELAVAVVRAPSVHNSQPWELAFGDDGSVSLFERLDLALPCHDPTGRDRLISCGAALANLELAVAVLGRQARSLLFPDPLRPDEVARVVTTEPRPPSDVELGRYAAITRRRSYRGPFAVRALPDGVRHDLPLAHDTPGVRVRPVSATGELTHVAELLRHAGSVLRDDQDYQHELSLWTNAEQGSRSGAGIPRLRGVLNTLPWAGLVRSTTSLPDVPALTTRLAHDYLLLFETVDDGHRDHVRAGRAVQQTWLAATRGGLAASVLTQPLHVPEARASLVERLGLGGFPQALMRLGYPIESAPPTPRMPVADLIRPGAEEDR